MKKFLFTTTLVILGLYLVLHLVLGSSPVQRRVVEEIRAALGQVGIDLKIESIEFSAFSPKVYLNRVTLTSTSKAPVQFPHPLAIDKIKIEFQPIALISKRLVIEEATLYHPRIIVPNADQLYKRIDTLIKSQKRVEVQGGTFKVVVKRFGVVDALIDVASQDPPLALRSRSLTVTFQNSTNTQQTITASSRNLELERGKLKLNLTNLDLDVDTTSNSIRINRSLVEGDNLYLNVKGASSLPQKGQTFPSMLNASYDVKIPLDLLNRIPELKTPELAGLVASNGTVRLAEGKYSGSGKLSYEGVSIDGYLIGRGEAGYHLSEQRVTVSNLLFHYGGGELSAKTVHIDLKDKYPIVGDFALHGIALESVLASIKNPGTPLHLKFDGPMTVKGQFAPFDLKCDLKAQTSALIVYHPTDSTAGHESTVINIPPGKIEGTLAFGMERMSFQANAHLLSGNFQTEGFISYDNVAKVRVKGEQVSLTELKQISELHLGGIADLKSEIDVVGKDVKIGGDFEVEGGEVGGVVLGDLQGQAFFHDMLLSFENLERATSLEPVRGNGFVDFGADPTHYKFHVETKRIDVGEAFGAFQKKKLAFKIPQGGETGARLSIEGGHDEQGIEVVVSGQARNFNWYDEDWLTTQFFVSFRPEVTDLRRLLLMKKNGGVELRARFGEKSSTMNIMSRGLRIDELKHIGKSRVSGEVVGEITLEGDLTRPTGRGELKIINSNFRNTAFPDSTFRLSSEQGSLEIEGRLFGDSLRGRLARSKKNSDDWDLVVIGDEFDSLPFFSVLLGKEVPTLNDVKLTGRMELNGKLTEWESFRGKGVISKVNLGLRGTPMTNQAPLDVAINDGAIEVDKFSLEGKDGQLKMDFLYNPNKQVRSSIDGKLDLEFLQPFIPGLDFGTGKLSAGIRVSGHPSNYTMIGNITLDDGTIRLTGLNDEFKSVQAQLSLSQDKINIDKFEALINGGNLTVDGDVHINKLRSLVPKLNLIANGVALRTGTYLTTRFSGNFSITGDKAPYNLGGKCRILEGKLTQFDVNLSKSSEYSSPIFKLDVTCDAKEKLYVTTDIMNAEFKGNFHLLGTNTELGLLGQVEVVEGSLLFRERKFKLTTANVKFESPVKIAPRFNVSGRTLVKESKASNAQNTQLQASQEYEVNLQAYGTPSNYKLILTSTPELAEADIISLLLLGVTGRGSDGNYADLGSAVVGSLPFQQKLENQLGFDIRLNTKTNQAPMVTNTTAGTASAANSDLTVPAVQVSKSITDKTTVSYSNTLQATPAREFKIEHMLDNNWSVNGVAGERPRGGTDPNSTSQSYGLDFRYRFQFE